MTLSHHELESALVEQGRELCAIKETVKAIQQNQPLVKDVGRIATAIEGLKPEFDQTQRILLVIARHLIGGMSPDEVEQAQAEAQKLALDLQQSRRELSAAVKSQSKP